MPAPRVQASCCGEPVRVAPEMLSLLILIGGRHVLMSSSHLLAGLSCFRYHVCLVDFAASVLHVDSQYSCVFPALSEEGRCEYICYQQVICRARCSNYVVAPSFQSCSSCGSSSRGVFTDGPVSRVLIRVKSRCDSHEKPAPHRQHEVKRHRTGENLRNADLGADMLFEE